MVMMIHSAILVVNQSEIQAVSRTSQTFQAAQTSRRTDPHQIARRGLDSVSMEGLRDMLKDRLRIVNRVRRHFVDRDQHDAALGAAGCLFRVAALD